MKIRKKKDEWVQVKNRYMYKKIEKEKKKDRKTSRHWDIVHKNGRVHREAVSTSIGSREGNRKTRSTSRI